MVRKLIRAEDLECNEWQWVEFPAPVLLKGAPNGDSVFLFASENPTIDEIRIDAFELLPR